MKRTSLVLLLALVACKKGGGGGGGADCEGAVDNMFSLQMAAMPKDMDDKMKKTVTDLMTKAKTAIVGSCKEMKWSAEALRCIKGLKSAAEGKNCDDKLTKEQRDAAAKAADAAAYGPAEQMNKVSDADKQAAIKGITELKDAMCACKDAACGEDVYKKWGEHEHASEHARHDEATKTEWEKLDDEMMKCKQALK